MLDSLYNYAKFQYECGNYANSADNLYFYRVLVSLKKQCRILLGRALVRTWYMYVL